MLNGQTAAGLPRFSYVGARFGIWGLNVPFDSDERFTRAWARTVSEVRDHFAHRTPEVLETDWKAYVCCWAGRQALQVEGDFVECGVNLGVLSGTVADYLDFASLPRTFWLYDTFKGIPPEQMSPTEAAGLAGWHNKHNYTTDVYDLALQRFARFPNARLVRGRVPDTLAEQAPETVAFLNLDMNIAYPTVAAAEFFWPRLVRGTVILLDDDLSANHEQEMFAIQEFAAERDLLVFGLPTGQGLIIKPRWQRSMVGAGHETPQQHDKGCETAPPVARTAPTRLALHDALAAGRSAGRCASRVGRCGGGRGLRRS